MIKNTYVDPLQESMEIKMYNERYAAIAPSEFNIGLEGAYMHAAQIEQAYNALMEQVGIAELKYYNETGYTLSQGYYIEAEAEANEAKKGNIKDAIKAAPGKAKGIVSTFVKNTIEFLKLIKQKLAAAFKKIKNVILDLNVANKAFFVKYSIQLKDRKDEKIKLTSFTFPGLGGLKIDSPNPDFKAAVSKIEIKTGSDESITSARMQFRRVLVPGIPYTDASEDFMAAARNALYGEKEATSQSVGDALNLIKSTDAIIRNLNKQYADADKTLDNMIKEVERENKTINKEENPSQVNLIKAKITLYKQAASDMQAYCQLRSKALVDRLRYSKAICVKALQRHEVADKVTSTFDRGKKKVKDAVGRIGESASIEDIFNLQFT